MSTLSNPPKSTDEYIANLNLEIARLADLNSLFMKALEGMCNAFGMHGPCRNHSCSDCRVAYKNAKALIAHAKGGAA